MTVILYRNRTDNRYLTKDIVDAKTLSNVAIYDDNSIVEPILKVQASTIIADKYNYAYVQEFGRYYYIKNTTVSNGYILLNLKCDVLKTYSSQIRACRAIIKRNENNFNFYLNDNQFKTLAYDNQHIHNFPTVPFKKTGNYILVVQGG